MVKRLLCKSEDLSLDARDPLKKLGAMPPSVILALGREAETRESLQLNSLLVLLNCWVSGSGRDPDSKQSWSMREEDTQHQVLASAEYSQACIAYPIFFKKKYVRK